MNMNNTFDQLNLQHSLSHLHQDTLNQTDFMLNHKFEKTTDKLLFHNLSTLKDSAFRNDIHSGHAEFTNQNNQNNIMQDNHHSNTHNYSYNNNFNELSERILNSEFNVLKRMTNVESTVADTIADKVAILSQLQDKN
mmetsp:Transcript_44656/g.97512  ORF Transcript_44656/g.97512 Transcript_44656/m.97512 type:complete len:137 (-) Transcript_44656:2397-2807(-)